MMDFTRKLLLLTAVAAVAAFGHSDAIELVEDCGASCSDDINAQQSNILSQHDAKLVELQQQLTHIQENLLKNNTVELNKYKDELVAVLRHQLNIDQIHEFMELIKLHLDANNEAFESLRHQVDILNVSMQHDMAKGNGGEMVEDLAMNCMPFKDSSGIHDIHIDGVGKVSVLCDANTAESGWIVVQTRFNGNIDFFRNWSDYRTGFGDLNGEFFIGLEKLHRLTKSLPYELYIQLVDFSNDIRYARYDNFLIGSEKERYMLKSVGTYTGNAGDSLSYNLHDSFTTYDRDNDSWPSGNCADWYNSGWWYGLYGNSNLNGKYFDLPIMNQKSIWWYNWKGYKALRSVKMMIRPKYTSL